MREFELALAELTEAYIDADIEFNAYMEDLAIDEEGYYYSESANEYLLEADLKEMGNGAKQAIGNMVQSFFDFLNGAFQNLCAKLKQRPDLKGMASSLQAKAKQAKNSVAKYWNEVKAIKETGATGKFATLKNKISTIVSRFKKMCEDAGAKIKAAAGKAVDSAKAVPGKVKAAPGAVKSSVNKTMGAGAAARAEKEMNKADAAARAGKL